MTAAEPAPVRLSLHTRPVAAHGRILALAWGAWASGFFSLMLLSFVLQPLQDAFGLSEAALARLTAVGVGMTGAGGLLFGWLSDRFGFSWQVVPRQLFETIGGPDAAGRGRAMNAMMQMVKLDVAKLQAAYAGEDIDTRSVLAAGASAHARALSWERCAAATYGLPRSGKRAVDAASGKASTVIERSISPA